MSYAGDIRLGDTIDVKFTTRSFSTGAPTTLAGTPVISAYPGNSTTQITAGITLTVDFDTVTGLHNVRVVASSGNGYATATNYYLVITTGTVGGVSVVGEVVGSFSIEARSALMPTTAARTIDVTATGAAGIDWANVENPTTALNLSATNIDVDQVVASVSGAVGSVTGAVGSVTGNVGGNVAGSVNSVTTGVTLAASAVQAIWDALTTALTTVGSIGKLLVDNVNATISSRSSHSAADVWASATRTLTSLGARLDRSTSGIVTGTVGSGSTTTSVVTSSLDPAASVADQYKGRIVTFAQDTTTAALRGQSTDITANTNVGVLTVTALTTAPVSGDTFSIT